jgi:DnaJ-class molecular chaperone
VAPNPARASALLSLGLAGNPSVDEIRRAYKQAAMLWHPDRPQNHGCAEEAKNQFQEIKTAFDLLMNPGRRLAATAGA